MNSVTKEYLITKQDSRTIFVFKGVLAVMVVFIHANYGGINLSTGNIEFGLPVWLEIVRQILSEYIPRCAVPGFFVIAAVLLYKKPFSWKGNMKKKVKTLLVPYLMINAFWIVFYYIAQTVPSLCPYFSDPNKMVRNWGVVEFLDAFLGFGKSNGVAIIYCPLWFVRDLFCLNIISIQIKKIIDRFPIIYGVFLAFVVILNISSPIFCLSRNAVVFFSIGCYCVKYNMMWVSKVGYYSSDF